MKYYQMQGLKRRLLREQWRIHDEITLTSKYRRGSYSNNSNFVPSFTYYQHPKLVRIYDSADVSISPQNGDFFTPTPYVKSSYEIKGCCFIGVANYQANGALRGYSHCSYLSPGSASWGSLYPDRRSAAMTSVQRQINQKVLNGLPSWDILTDCAELRATAEFSQMLVRSMSEVAQGVLSKDARRVARGFGLKPTKTRVRHINRYLTETIWVNRNSMNVIDAMSGLWMKYRYGLNPTLYSLHDALNAFTKSAITGNLKGFDQRFVATVKDPSYKLSRTTFTPLQYRCGYDLCTSQVVEAGIRAIALVSYQDDMATRLIGNPYVAAAVTTYEVTKLSWVLDWFYNIGSFLRELNLSSVVARSIVSMSEKSKVTHKYWVENLKPYTTYKYKIVESGGVQASASSFIFQRWIGSLSVTPPEIGSGLASFNHFIDSLALSNQKLRRLTGSKLWK